MNKRCIGIDIGPDYLSAVQVSRTDEGLFVEKTYSVKTRRAADSPSDKLTDLFILHGFDDQAETAVSIPDEAVLLRNVETGAETIEQSSALQDGSIPNPDQFITKIHDPKHQTGRKKRALLISVDRGRLRKRLHILQKANIRPVLAETALFAANAAVVLNHPEAASGIALIIHLDKTHLTITITQAGSVTFGRKLPVFDDNNLAAAVDSEIRLTYRKFFDSDISSDTKIYLIPELENSKTIEAELTKTLHCNIIHINPLGRVQHDQKLANDTNITIAEGLALRALSLEDTTGLNFVDALQGGEKHQFDPKKELKTIAKLSTAIILVAIASLFIRLWKLERQYGKIQKQTAELFQQTLPDEKNIVNPLVQMDQKITSLQAGYASIGGAADTSSGPLEIIQQLTQNVPEQADVTVDSLLMSSDSVRITGTAGTFAPVYEWQQQLQQVLRFASVDVKDIQRLTAGKTVSFTIVIAMAREKTQ